MGPRRGDGARHSASSKSSGTFIDVSSLETVPIVTSSATRPGNASQAAAAEHRLSLAQALRLYPQAAAWSMLISTTIVMVAYDTVLLQSFYAYPSFRRKYGVPANGKDQYQVPASWQSALSNGSNVGGIVGLLASGYLADVFGPKTVLLGALAAIVGFIFIPFFAPNLLVLEVGEILCGVPWGMFQGLTTAYASEVTPVVLRPYLTSYINLCWVMGHFLGSGVLRALLGRNDQWGYRIPFAIQWVWPVPLFLGIYAAPDSPWYLLRKGRLKDAECALRRLTHKATENDVKDTVAMMVRTNEIEAKLREGTLYVDCFRGVNLRRTEIVVMAYVIQYLSGNGLAGYSAYFFEQAGLSASHSFDLTMGQYAIGFVGTLFSWILMGNFGRRALYLVGLTLSCMALLTIGLLSLAPASHKGVNWGIGALILVFFTIHSCFIGPVLYAIVAEMPSTRLRQKSIVLAASSWSIAGIINSALTPYMLNPSAWDWKGKAGFFWFGSCFLSLVWTWLRLPEGKGRTYAELEMLFAKGVSARQFANYAVNPFEGDGAQEATDDEV